MTQRPGLLIVVLFLEACCESAAPRRVADPIPGIPEHQQRSIARTDFPRAWPFTVGTGTMGCVDGAVAFRANNVTYALNDTAASRGLAPADPIRLTRHPPPSNPALRLTQNRRMKIFAESHACAGSSSCRQRVREVHALSDAELIQIEAEGQERHWPPLPPERISLQPVVDAGLTLCRL